MAETAEQPRFKQQPEVADRRRRRRGRRRGDALLRRRRDPDAGAGADGRGCPDPRLPRGNLAGAGRADHRTRRRRPCRRRLRLPRRGRGAGARAPALPRRGRHVRTRVRGRRRGKPLRFALHAGQRHPPRQGRAVPALHRVTRSQPSTGVQVAATRSVPALASSANPASSTACASAASSSAHAVSPT